MPRIRPDSDLKEHYEEVSAYCRERKEPVFVTRHGHGDLVVMSLEVYELLVQSMDIYRLDRFLQEGRLTEISSVMQRMGETGKDDARSNVRELKSQDDQGSDFPYKGSAQARSEVSAAVQKIRQEFVKPQE